MMNNHFKYFCSFDIGSSKIVAILGYLTEENNKQILHIENIEKQNLSLDFNYETKELREKINILINDLNLNELDIDDFYVTLSSPEIKFQIEKSSKIVNDFISENDKLHLISKLYDKYEQNGSSLLHIIPIKYLIDDKKIILDPVGDKASKLSGEFFVIYIPKNHLEIFETIFNSLGIKIKAFFYSAIASAEAVLKEDDKEIGSLIIDIGAKYTNIAVFSNKKIIFTKTLPLGGNLITEDLKKAIKITKQNAEFLKINYSAAIYSRSFQKYKINSKELSNSNLSVSLDVVSSVVQLRLVQFFDTIKKYILQNLNEDQIGRGTYLTGGTAKIPGIDELFKYRTDITASVKKPIIPDFIVLNQELKQYNIDEQFSSAIGSAILIYKLFTSSSFTKNSFSFDNINPQNKKLVNKLSSFIKKLFTDLTSEKDDTF